ncbi:unnamed protein product [Brassica oleracea var. botrytis]|uniref:(rape) hypothetical protein n=1 Tax=Brassica napus TaxID=3708 RepID=A0A816JUM8_BRANA|nr:unnamed protein product [Brassica napus]
MSTTLVPSMTTTVRRRRFDLDVDSGRAMSEWSLGFEVADNRISVGKVVRWRRNHKNLRRGCMYTNVQTQRGCIFGCHVSMT